MGSRTVYRVLEEAARQYGGNVALKQPHTENGTRTVREWTWNEYRTAAEEIAAGLRSLGVQRGDIVALNSETRAEFYLADLGTMTNGSMAAALYPSYPVKDLVRTIAGCDATALFVENEKMFRQLREAPVKHFFLLTGEAEGALSLEQLRQRGRDAMAADTALLPGILNEVQVSDPAILYLTSGATGEPKMVVVTHDALVSNIDMGPAILPLGPSDITIAFLPSAHIAQRVVIELLPIRSGMPVYFAESLLKLPPELKAVRPTLFLAPPRLWERIYSTICTEVRKRPAIAQKVFYAAVGLGLAAAKYRRQDKRPPFRIAAPLRIADRLVFTKIRERFGGRLRVGVSGAAPLGTELAEFYEAIGMPLTEGYGLTEGGVAAFNPIGRAKPGSIGKPVPGMDVRIAEDGELLMKGPCHFSYYYKDPETTAQVLRDGWLHTGDVAHIDSEGYIFITGRKKEMIVSSNGKKIFPSRVENLFKFEPLISQVLLVGDRLPYLTSLFTIHPAVAETLDGMDSWLGRPHCDLPSAPPVVAEVQKIVNRVNKNLAPFEQIRKFRILPRDFTIENGELTATMKVRRQQVIENFRDQVDLLYAGKSEGVERA
ncbi:MAG: long-chain fatty acid--CoA ligase [Acidobacteriota bacterium]|nr:long-chain fatty acid--CoA ligase [Acidobacteriota bacterium]